MSALDKGDLLLAMAAHVQGNGLAGASLRPLARAAGTSDRMLIYHFGSKSGLMAALLSHLTHDMLRAVAAALPPKPAKSEAACLREAVALLRTPTFRPQLRVWFDILSAAGRGDEASRLAADDLLTGYHGWLMARLPAGTKTPAARASDLLAILEGVLVMEIAGQGAAIPPMLDRLYPDT